MTKKSQSPITIGELLRRHRLDASLSQRELAQLIPYTDSVISRVENDLRGPEPAYIDQFVAVLHLSVDDEQEIRSIVQARTQENGHLTSRITQEDWGEALDVSLFYGREAELAELTEWNYTESRPKISILVIGEICKTTLVTKLANEVKTNFDYVIWRSLRNAPPLEIILSDYVKFLSGQQLIDYPADIGRQITILIDYLRQHRCLLLLDNVEAILQAGGRAGHYITSYEDYGQLFQRIGESDHQSCLIITSREKPKEFVPLTSLTAPVRYTILSGFNKDESRALLQDRHMIGDDATWIALTQRYAGNPLALRQVSANIQDLFGGDISTFLTEITTMFGEMRYLLDQQFNRLSKLEQDIMYWLAINREPISVSELREDLFNPVSTGDIVEALEGLQRRSLIEGSAGHFTLQNVVIEYVTERLVERVCEEITLGKTKLLQSHALIKGTSKTYVRESQTRLILAKIV
ncbi:MAG: helix-turn-helix transcriptional regulator, partial [Chloroflexota bacterium]